MGSLAAAYRHASRRARVRAIECGASLCTTRYAAGTGEMTSLNV